MDEEGVEQELEFTDGKSEPVSSAMASFDNNEVDLFPKPEEEVENLASPTPLAIGMDVTNVDSSSVYTNSEFYKESLFGIAGNFHLVGLTQIENPAHTNGNILTPKLIYGSNFGTNRLEIKEVSYAREIVTSRSMTAGAEDNPESYFVVGKNTVIGTAVMGTHGPYMAKIRLSLKKLNANHLLAG